MGLNELVGIAALVTIIVNILKQFNVIPDGWAGFAALVGDLLLMIIGAVAGFFEYDLAGIDQIAAAIAQLLALLVGGFAIHTLGRRMNLPLFRKRPDLYPARSQYPHLDAGCFEDDRTQEVN